MKFLLADDHAIFRRGIRDLIFEELHNAKFDEACNGNELVSLALNNEYDLIISDINMPEKSGLESIKEITNAKINTPILVLSIHNAIEYEVRVFRAGAQGYLNKDTEIEKMYGAIKQVISGANFFSEELYSIVNSAKLKNQERSLHQKLSDREFEIFKLLINGLSPLEIAHKLSLGKTTISTFKKRIFEKMEMFSVSELTKYAIEKGLA